MAFTQLQETINRINSGQMSVAELRLSLSHASPLVRANAINALVARLHEDESLVDEIVAFAENPKHSFRLMGTTSVAHLAVLALLRSVSTAVRLAGEKLVRTWPESDRKDLVWFLESEGIRVTL